MGEADLVAFDLDHLRRDSGLQRSGAPGDERDGGPWERCRRDERPSRVGRQFGEALLHEPGEVLRHGKGLTRFEPAAATLDRPSKLEGEERVAIRRVVDPAEEWARGREVESGAKERVDGSEAQRPDDELVDGGRREDGPQPRGRIVAGLCAMGEQSANPPVAAAPERIEEDGGRGGVEPLEVVDRDEDGRACVRRAPAGRSGMRPRRRGRPAPRPARGRGRRPALDAEARVAPGGRCPALRRADPQSLRAPA